MNIWWDFLIYFLVLFYFYLLILLFKLQISFYSLLFVVFCYYFKKWGMILLTSARHRKIILSNILPCSRIYILRLKTWNYLWETDFWSTSSVLWRHCLPDKLIFDLRHQYYDVTVYQTNWLLLKHYILSFSDIKLIKTLEIRYLFTENKKGISTEYIYDK